MRSSFVSMSRAVAIAAVALSCSGCGPTGYKITPIPVDRTIEEEKLYDEGGLALKKVVVIDVSGIILNSSKTSLLLGEQENAVSYLVERLDRAEKDSRVAGVILRINSPGGSVTASDLMYAELQRFKQQTNFKKPVIAVLMDVAASGGYYLACGADEIIAHRTSITGSIGVIMQMLDVSGTMQKIGVSADAITSGKMKAAGSPFRKMTAEEREIFQTLVNGMYDQFVRVVADGREGLNEAQVRELADGRVYSAQQAVDMGFVDRIGTLRDGVDSIKERTGVDRVRVVTYKRPLAWKPNIYAETPASAPQANFININMPQSWPYSTPQFMYLWAPGS